MFRIASVVRATLALAAALVAQVNGAFAADAYLINNARIFDGVDIVTERGAVRVDNGLITAVSKTPLASKPGETVIDAAGRFLMPGMIDAHVHVSSNLPFDLLSIANESLIGASAAPNAKAMLMRGFTTVRDTGGTDWGVATAIDRGIIEGPRIIFAGRVLTQTGGHGDNRGQGAPSDLHQRFQFGSVVADGTPEVLQGAREELRRGSHFLKIMAGGGVASPRDPLHSIQYTPEEMAAAVTTAKNWGTYVAAHAYTPGAIKRALNAGVMTIEHGNLIDREAAELAASKGAWVNPNLVTYWAMDQSPDLPAYLKEKNKVTLDAMTKALDILKAAGTNIGFGTDLIAQFQAHQSYEFVLRSEAFSGLEILRQATSGNAGIIALSGPLNPYGELGAIAPGLRADLLLIDGDPTADIKIMATPDEVIDLIMKDGRIVKGPVER
ncbi:MAG: amidohydrolase family protein [Alphaproteobacteria bacterium]|nr:amidohydrolase family protein [Alphaproteobacteria bacterium]